MIDLSQPILNTLDLAIHLCLHQEDCTNKKMIKPQLSSSFFFWDAAKYEWKKILTCRSFQPPFLAYEIKYRKNSLMADFGTTKAAPGATEVLENWVRRVLLRPKNWVWKLLFFFLEAQKVGEQLHTLRTRLCRPWPPFFNLPFARLYKYFHLKEIKTAI